MPAARFALAETADGGQRQGGLVTLAVENEGQADEFEATVLSVQGDVGRAPPPWYVRWRNTATQTKAILPGHSWILELCEQPPHDAAAGSAAGASWLFRSPDGERLVAADEADAAGGPPAAVMRVAVRVTPRSDPRAALENTLTLSASPRGRVAVWDRRRVE